MSSSPKESRRSPASSSWGTAIAIGVIDVAGLDLASQAGAIG